MDGLELDGAETSQGMSNEPSATKAFPMEETEESTVTKAPEPVIAGRGRPRKSDAPKKLDEVQQSSIESTTGFMLVTPSLKRGRGRPPNPFKIVKPKPDVPRSVGRPRIHPPKPQSDEPRSVGRPRIHPIKMPSGRGPGRPRVHPSKTVNTKRFAMPHNMKSLQIRLVKNGQGGEKRRGRPPGSKNKKKHFERPKIQHQFRSPFNAENGDSNSKESLSYQDFVKQVNEELLAIHGSIPGDNSQTGPMDDESGSDDMDTSLDDLDDSTEDFPSPDSSDQNVSTENTSPKKRRGRPPGAKNKRKDFCLDMQLMKEPSFYPSGKRRGRPPGAKNKPKEFSFLRSDSDIDEIPSSPFKKRGRGRPPGAKNKPKEFQCLGSESENSANSYILFMSEEQNGVENSSEDISAVESYTLDSEKDSIDSPTEKRRPGRPVGAKDKCPSGRRRGRKPGAKNKANISLTSSDLDTSIDESGQRSDMSPVRKVGRPPGAKNKPKENSSDEHNISTVTRSPLRILFRSPSEKRKPGRPPLAKTKHDSSLLDYEDNLNVSLSPFVKRRPGRPPGAKNKPKLDYMLGVNVVENSISQSEKRRPGRPPGAKNKPKLEFDSTFESISSSSPSEKRGPGRPPGAKNKPKLDYSICTEFQLTEDESELLSVPSTPPRKRGRPPGAKNRLKLALSPKMFVKMDTGEISGVFDNSILSPSGKRRPGRPPGAKNKPKDNSPGKLYVKVEPARVLDTEQSSDHKRKPGRPPGAKNKVKTINLGELVPSGSTEEVNYTEDDHDNMEEGVSSPEEKQEGKIQNGELPSSGESPVKRKRGRPPGSGNKKAKFVNDESMIQDESENLNSGRRRKVPVNYAAMASGSSINESDLSEEEDEVDESPTKTSTSEINSTQENSTSIQISVRGRGRPRKPKQRGPGRPRKIKPDIIHVTVVGDESDAGSDEDIAEDKTDKPKNVLDMTCEDDVGYDPSGISGITMDGWEGFTGTGDSSRTCTVTKVVSAGITTKPSSQNQDNSKPEVPGGINGDAGNDNGKKTYAFIDDVVIQDSNLRDKSESDNVETSAASPELVVKSHVPAGGSFVSVIDLSDPPSNSGFQSAQEGSTLDALSSEQIDSADSYHSVVSNHVNMVEKSGTQASVAIKNMTTQTVVDIMLTSEPNHQNDVNHAPQKEVVVSKAIAEALPQTTNSVTALFIDASMS